MKRLRLFGARPRIREMRLSGFIVRQAEGSNVVTVKAPDGATISAIGELTAGNVRRIIIESGRPPAAKEGTK